MKTERPDLDAIKRRAEVWLKYEGSAIPSTKISEDFLALVAWIEALEANLREIKERTGWEVLPPPAPR